jgi:hypothetical protein
MSLRSDLSFDIGEDWGVTLSCFQADGVTPLDLTGASAVWAIGGTVAAPVATAAGSIASPPTAGVVSFRVPPGAQTSFQAGNAPYTIRVTLAGGAVTDQAYGNLKIRAA